MTGPRRPPAAVVGVAWAALALLGAAGGVGCRGALLFEDNTGCLKDSDCPLPTLHCQTQTGSCFACTDDTQCTGDLHRCDTALHRCIGCGTDTDCGAGQICDQKLSRCMLKCTTASVCPTSAPRCDDGLCKACDDGKGCETSADGPFCIYPPGVCARCRIDADCSGATPLCDTVGGKCVQCLASSDCAMARPVCDPATLSCVSGR